LTFSDRVLTGPSFSSLDPLWHVKLRPKHSKDRALSSKTLSNADRTLDDN
jgi:hypothetical protein